MNQEIKIENFGYDKFLVARVIGEYRGSYKVKTFDGEYLAKVTGKQMFKALSREDYPAVGDWVAIVKLDKENAIIRSILPRKTIIKRKDIDRNEIQVIATNIDVALIVESVDRDFNLNRFERYFAIAKDGGVKPSIILNKIDLISKDDLNKKVISLRNRFNNVDVILTSTINSEGLDELRTYILNGKTYCFLGSSGVGKSSLINKLLRKNIIKTKDIGVDSDRGRHTTTNREMYFLENGGIVIDNPGMREVGMTNTIAGVDILFDEIHFLAKKCKFGDCAHIHEPGCEVLSAVKSGRLDEQKYLNYINLKKEAEHYEMTEIEKKEKERQFGNFIKNAKKEIKKYK
jgi:ribosome biogenesis GTPase / thiamine phosphate phosphatase